MAYPKLLLRVSCSFIKYGTALNSFLPTRYLIIQNRGSMTSMQFAHCLLTLACEDIQRYNCYYLDRDNECTDTLALYSVHTRHAAFVLKYFNALRLILDHNSSGSGHGFSALLNRKSGMIWSSTAVLYYYTSMQCIHGAFPCRDGEEWTTPTSSAPK
jgi:hypothetical protein